MQLKHHPDKVGRIDGIKLPPASIKIDKAHNIRDMAAPSTREHIEELKLSIKAVGGVQKPIQVRMIGEDAFVTDGECRLTAVMELIRDEGFPIESLVCILEPGGTDEVERMLNFGAAGTAQRYTELELAEWCRRLDRLGVAHDKIAATAGWKSKSSVKTHLDMISQMPEPVKQMVRDSEVSASLAMKFLKEEPEQAAELLRQNREQNKRLGVGAKMKHKVTPRTLSRDRPKPAKPERPELVQGGYTAPIGTGERPPLPTTGSGVMPAALAMAMLGGRTIPTGSETTTVSPPLSGAGAEPAQEATPSTVYPAPVAHLDLLPVLTELTKHAKHVLTVNRSDEAPGGFWTQDLVDAVRVAERVIGLCGNGHDPYQVFDAAVEETKALAEGADA